MNIRTLGVALVAALVGAISFSNTASAVPYTLQFSFSGFSPAGAPTDPVSGTLVFDKSAADFSINSLTSIDLTIAGHTYGLAEIGFINPPFSVQLGGLVNGVDLVSAFTNDFSFSWDQTTGSLVVDFAYATPGSALFADPSTSTLTFTENSVAAVPLPGALPLFATVLAGGVLMGWRRRRQKAA